MCQYAFPTLPKEVQSIEFPNRVLHILKSQRNLHENSFHFRCGFALVEQQLCSARAAKAVAFPPGNPGKGPGKTNFYEAFRKETLSRASSKFALKPKRKASTKFAMQFLKKRSKFKSNTVRITKGHFISTYTVVSQYCFLEVSIQ